MPGIKCDNFVVHQEQPLNAEPPLTELVQYPITPDEFLYARNHCESLNQKLRGLYDINSIVLSRPNR